MKHMLVRILVCFYGRLCENKKFKYNFFWQTGNSRLSSRWNTRSFHRNVDKIWSIRSFWVGKAVDVTTKHSLKLHETHVCNDFDFSPTFLIMADDSDGFILIAPSLKRLTKNVHLGQHLQTSANPSDDGSSSSSSDPSSSFVSFLTDRCKAFSFFLFEVNVSFRQNCRRDRKRSLCKRFSLLWFGEASTSRVSSSFCLLRKIHGIVWNLISIKVVRNRKNYKTAAYYEISILESIKDNERWVRLSNQLQCCLMIFSSNCVRLLNHFVFRNHVCLVFDKHAMNLYDHLQSTAFRGISALSLREIAHQVLVAVRCKRLSLKNIDIDHLSDCHEKQIVHTDIKPENICLLQSAQKDGQIPGVCLVDFGNAIQEPAPHPPLAVSGFWRGFPSVNSFNLWLQCTRHYRAPEILLKLDWGFEVDIWSVGCVLLELWTGHLLFDRSYSSNAHVSLSLSTSQPFSAVKTQYTSNKSSALLGPYHLKCDLEV